MSETERVLTVYQIKKATISSCQGVTPEIRGHLVIE